MPGSFNDNENPPPTSIPIEPKKTRSPNKLYYTKDNILLPDVIRRRKKTDKAEISTKKTIKKLERNEAYITLL